MRARPALDAPPREPPGHPEAAPVRRSAADRLAADRAKYVRGPAPAGSSSRAEEGESAPPPPVARRVIARRPLRPDSLVMYRQKCEFVRGPDGPGKKLLQVPARGRPAATPNTPAAGAERRPGAEEGGRARRDPAAPSKSLAATSAPPAGVPAAIPVAPARVSASSPAVPSKVPAVIPATSVASARVSPARPAPPPPAPPTSLRAPAPPAPASPAPAPPAPGSELRGVRRRGLQRSQSDLSSRQSVSMAELAAFFQSCGLEPDVVAALGRDNLAGGSERGVRQLRSLSVATSDSGFSRRSGSVDGLQEDELAGRVPSATSVVERNARIIKWLYTCRKAKEAAGQGLQAR